MSASTRVRLRATRRRLAANWHTIRGPLWLASTPLAAVALLGAAAAHVWPPAVMVLAILTFASSTIHSFTDDDRGPTTQETE